MKRIFMAGLAAISLICPAWASDSPIKAVDVQFDIQAIESAEAATFWADLEKDLETAIIQRVVDRLARRGATIRIDINEFEMSNSFAAALGADSKLSGDIAVRNPDDSRVNSFYELTLRLDEAGKMTTDETGSQVLTVPLEVAYRAMVDAFADGVVSRLR